MTEDLTEGQMAEREAVRAKRAEKLAKVLNTPAIVIPDDQNMSLGEAVALATMGAVNAVEAELERARALAALLQAHLDTATEALGHAVKMWPETSWAHDSLAKERLENTLVWLTDPEANPEPATMVPAPDTEKADDDPKGTPGG